MKIGVCSDLHLEFGDINIKNEDNVDVLILSGDILVDADMDMRDRRQTEMGFARERSERFHDFFDRVCFQFPHVVYVVGNHEHYHGDFKYTIENLKRKLAHHKNLYILDKECKKIDDVFFIGGTMWTDMNKEDPLTMYHMTSMMNDFRCVENSNRMVEQKVPRYELNPDYTPDGLNGRKYAHNEAGQMIQIGEETRTKPSRFNPYDAVEDHKKFLDYVKVCTQVLGDSDQKYVVVGHHTPSHQSTHPRYKEDKLMNGGYHSDLDAFIEVRPMIKLWTHGHTHEAYDYMIGETRVVCNPRGYIGYEKCADEFKLKVVEV